MKFTKGTKVVVDYYSYPSLIKGVIGGDAPEKGRRLVLLDVPINCEGLMVASIWVPEWWLLPQNVTIFDIEPRCKFVFQGKAWVKIPRGSCGNAVELGTGDLGMFTDEEITPI